MISSSSFESQAEVFYPPLFPIPRHGCEGLVTSSHKHCICVRFWYWACPPVMWIWSANVTSYLRLTLYYIAEGMMMWHYCSSGWHRKSAFPPWDRLRSHLLVSKRCDTLCPLWVTQSPGPRPPCQHSISCMICLNSILRTEATHLVNDPGVNLADLEGHKQSLRQGGKSLLTQNLRWSTVLIQHSWSEQDNCHPSWKYSLILTWII